MQNKFFLRATEKHTGQQITIGVNNIMKIVADPSGNAIIYLSDIVHAGKTIDFIEIEEPYKGLIEELNKCGVII